MEETTDTESGVRKGFEFLASLELESLIRKNELGDFDFSKYEEDFKSLIQTSKELLELPLETLKPERAEAIIKSGDALVPEIKTLKEFKPAQVENPTQVRNSIGDDIKGKIASLLSVVHHDLPYLLLKKKPINTEELKSKVAEVDSALEAIKESEKQIGLLLDASRTASGQIGVDAHSEDFLVLAKEHSDDAKLWLKVAAVLIALAVVVPLIFISQFQVTGDWTNVTNIQTILAKVAILFILYFLIAQALKNYRTHRHLYVVNKHRATSLRTFRTFVGSADSDESVKMQILLEASRTVFAPSNTGYLATEEENPNGRIVEILKMVKDGKP